MRKYLRIVSLAVALIVAAELSQGRDRDVWLHNWTASAAFFVDVGSLENFSKSTRQGWAHGYGVTGGTLANPGVYLDSNTLQQWDCAKHRSRIISGIVYLPSGEVKTSFDQENSEWSPVAPGTIGASALELVCANPADRSAYGIRVAVSDMGAWAKTVIARARANHP